MDVSKDIEEHIQSGKENELFPVFFRMDKLHVVVIGGGAVGTEKIGAILKNSPAASIKVVALEISQTIVDWSAQHPGLKLSHKAYAPSDLTGADLVIAATCIRVLNAQVQVDA